MGIRLSAGVATLLIAMLASDLRIATAGEPGRLAALTARQALRDEVCIALASGHISRADRYLILSHAKAILKPEEYAGFKRAMDRLSPPQTAVLRTTTLAAKKAAALEQPVSLQAEFAPEPAPEVKRPVQSMVAADENPPDEFAWATDMR